MDGSRTRYGFTLLEMLMVLALVGLLATLALPSYQSALQKGRRADAMMSLLQLQLRQEQWRANHPGYGRLGDVWSGDRSLEGFYTLHIGTRADGAAYRATARPKADGPQRGDRCGNFVLNQEGPEYGNGNADVQCWQR